MRVSALADLPGRSVATTSTYMTKLERFDEIKTRGKSNFENKFLEIVLFMNEIGASNFSRNYSITTQNFLYYF